MGCRGKGIAIGALMLLAGASPATAAPSWQPVQTLDLVRGVSSPDVGINSAGSSTVVFTSADTTFDQPRPWVAVRPPGDGYTVRYAKPGGQRAARVAVAPNGATAIAAIDDGRLYVTLHPAPGVAGMPGIGATDGTPTPVEVGGGLAVDGLRLGIDGAGRATVVWASPRVAGLGDSPTQIYFATVASPSWAPAIAHPLGEPGRCRPGIDVNLRGDVVVSRDCAGQPDDFFYRSAGGTFGPPEAPFAGSDLAPGEGKVGMALDGAGSVHAYNAVDSSGPRGFSLQRLAYAVRPPAGPFGASQPLPFASPSAFDLEAQEDGDVIASWGGSYSFRRSGEPFGPVRAVPGAERGGGYDLVTSPTGPALLSWRSPSAAGAVTTEQVMAATITSEGPSKAIAVGLRGEIGSAGWAPVSFAINDSGFAIGAWEQQCAPDGAWAVMAAALAERSTGNRPPCQDRRAPKVAVRPQRARLVGRQLRVRIGCDEACRIVVRARVLRGGKGRPLATAKTRGTQRIAARRYRTFALRLTKRQAAKTRTALVARRRVSVRLALSVRDGFENGAVRRVAVPLRR